MKNKILISVAFVFVYYCSYAQIESLKLPNSINLKQPTKEIIKEITKEDNSTILRIDTMTGVFPSIVYKVPLFDSICINFLHENFSSMKIYLNDSCYFLYIKAFCIENLKMTKDSKGSKGQMFLGKEYNINIHEIKSTIESKYLIWIRSKKYAIHI